MPERLRIPCCRWGERAATWLKIICRSVASSLPWVGHVKTVFSLKMLVPFGMNSVAKRPIPFPELFDDLNSDSFSAGLPSVMIKSWGVVRGSFRHGSMLTMSAKRRHNNFSSEICTRARARLTSKLPQRI